MATPIVANVSCQMLMRQRLRHRIGLYSLVLTAALWASDDASCQGSESYFAAEGYAIPYDLEAPTTRSWLPKRLDEISGLTVLDSTRIAAV